MQVMSVIIMSDNVSTLWRTKLATLPRQYNQILFGFGKNITAFSCFFRKLLVTKPAAKVLKSRLLKENVRNGHIYVQLMKQHMT